VRAWRIACNSVCIGYIELFRKLCVTFIEERQPSIVDKTINFIWLNVHGNVRLALTAKKLAATSLTKLAAIPAFASRLFLFSLF
jgi:hypothetical protein